VPVLLGLWWVHGIFLASTALMLAHQRGWFRQAWDRFRPGATA
jgi:hypothetical protein